MKLLDLTLPTPAENIALDEALLDAAEQGDLTADVLRLWESPQTIVVVGRSSRVAEEINVAACQQSDVPVLRRASGGAAIVAGPGCLMYSLILSYAARENLRLLDELHRHVLGIVKAAIATLIGNVEHSGTSDLAIWGRKFSGNSVRCKRDHLLYHGTLLYGFDLSLIDRLLAMPPRQPAYRANRPHAEFLANLSVASADLRRALATEFAAREPISDWPRKLTNDLVARRYSKDAWNFQR